MAFRNIVFTAILLSGCAHIPAKPVVTLGVIDYPANQVIENKTNGQAFKEIHSIKAATYQNVVAAIESSGNRVPLASYDSAVAFKPAQWEIVQNYIDALRAYLVTHCQ